MGIPDMKLPIQYALSYPQRIKSNFLRLSFAQYPSLTFEQPNTANFRNLALAFKALQNGGNQPCILNAANEVVVEAFLCERIGFFQMSDVIEQTLDKIPYIAAPNYEVYKQTNDEAKRFSQTLIDN